MSDEVKTQDEMFCFSCKTAHKLVELDENGYCERCLVNGEGMKVEIDGMKDKIYKMLANLEKLRKKDKEKAEILENHIQDLSAWIEDEMIKIHLKNNNNRSDEEEEESDEWGHKKEDVNDMFGDEEEENNDE